MEEEETVEEEIAAASEARSRFQSSIQRCASAARREAPAASKGGVSKAFISASVVSSFSRPNPATVEPAAMRRTTATSGITESPSTSFARRAFFFFVVGGVGVGLVAICFSVTNASAGHVLSTSNTSQGCGVGLDEMDPRNKTPTPNAASAAASRRRSPTTGRNTWAWTAASAAGLDAIVFALGRGASRVYHTPMFG